MGVGRGEPHDVPWDDAARSNHRRPPYCTVDPHLGGCGALSRLPTAVRPARLSGGRSVLAGNGVAVGAPGVHLSGIRSVWPPANPGSPAIFAADGICSQLEHAGRSAELQNGGAGVSGIGRILARHIGWHLYCRSREPSFLDRCAQIRQGEFGLRQMRLLPIWIDPTAMPGMRNGV